MRKGTYVVIAVVTIVVAAAGLYVGASQLFVAPERAPETIKLKVGSAVRTSEVYFLPMLIAEEQGIWKKNFLEVEWVPFRGGGPMYQGVAAGEVQIGLSSLLANIDARARGVKIKIVSVYIPNNTFEILVKGDGPIKKVEDLDGKVIGVSALGGFEQFLFTTIQKKFNIKYKEVVGTGGLPNSLAALESGSIHAFTFTINTVLEQIEGGKLRSILKMKDVLPTPWQEFVVFATDALIESNPEAVRRLVNAIQETVTFIEKNPDKAIEVYIRDTKAPRAIAQKAIANLRWQTDGRIDENAVKIMLDSAVEAGFISRDKAPPASEVFVTTFIPKPK